MVALPSYRLRPAGTQMKDPTCPPAPTYGFSPFLAAAPAAAQAQGLIATHRIPAALAAEAVTEAVAHCAGQGYAETAVLVDADGVTQAVLRGDRVGSHSLDSAHDKAYTAATFKTDTLALVERAKTAPGFCGPVHPASSPHPVRRRRGHQGW